MHVLEIERPGDTLYVMGPKPVLGEHVDGALATPPAPPAYAFTTDVYDGVVLASPGLDVNFAPTSYRFATPGPHTIVWRAGSLQSNVLCVDVD